MNHDHTGPWFGISVAIVTLIVWLYIVTLLYQVQLDTIYDRVADIQKQIECLPSETFVTDDEGNEYCIEEAAPR